MTNGARVIVSSRDEKVCKKASEELTKIGPGSCYYIAGDLSKEEECKVRTPECQFRPLYTMMSVMENDKDVESSR